VVVGDWLVGWWVVLQMNIWRNGSGGLVGKEGVDRWCEDGDFGKLKMILWRLT